MIRILLSIIFLTFTQTLFSQLVETEINNRVHDKKVVDVYQIVLDVDKSDAKYYWDDFIEDQKDKKIKGYSVFRKKDLLETEYTSFPMISDKPIKLFMEFEEVNDKTYLNLFAQKESGKYISAGKRADRQTFANIKKLGNSYLEYFLPVYYREVIRDAEDQFENTQKDLKKVSDDLKDKKAELEALKAEIVAAENEKILLEEKLEKDIRVLNRKKYSYDEIRKELDRLYP